MPVVSDEAATPGEDAVLVVDGANVVGSRPDGWWRDRPGAARRLHDRLVAADQRRAGYREVVLVLEGQAKAGVPAGDDVVRTVHAPRDGDGAIVELAAELCAAGDRVDVVTADRGLRARLAAVGARSLPPSWLRSRIE